MPARIVSILLSLVLLPLLAWGQAPAAEAEQALRARVTEFLQYHVEGNFRKAYDMVADDTKEHYFNIGKVQLKDFKIDKIQFMDDTLSKAAVTATMTKTIAIVGQEVVMSLPSTITWKIENGKWVWYDDFQNSGGTPMDPLVRPAATASPAPVANDDAGLPKDFSDKTITELARNIMQQVSVNKQEVTLATDKTSEEKVVLHNGMMGSVQLELSAPEVPGLTVKIEQSIIRAAQDVPVILRYEPAGQTGPMDPVTVQLTVQPLGQVFRIRVNFSKPQ